VVVIQVVIVGVFGMNVRTFDCVEVSTFRLAVQHLHSAADSTVP